MTYVCLFCQPNNSNSNVLETHKSTSFKIHNLWNENSTLNVENDPKYSQ